MAWDSPPPLSLAEVDRRLDQRIADLTAALQLVKKQRECAHHFTEERSTNLGGEREVSVTCLVCGFVWY
jgi:hypothetical protein